MPQTERMRIALRVGSKGVSKMVDEKSASRAVLLNRLTLVAVRWIVVAGARSARAALLIAHDTTRFKRRDPGRIQHETS